MSYQWIYREVLDSVFVPLRQTGYASMQDRIIMPDRARGLPLNYTFKSGNYVSLGPG